MSSNEGKSTAYSKERQKKYYEIEDRSWWFAYRIEIFLVLAERFFNKNATIYDIGGSNGYNAKFFQDNGYDIRLVEPTNEACNNAKKRGVKNVINRSLQDLHENIPQFTLLDVVEHIENDVQFLKSIKKEMPEGGVGLISVPASMLLWSSEDEIDGHYRRYNKKNLEEALDKAGFEICYINYFYQFLWLPIFIRRHLMEKFSLVHKVNQRTVEEETSVTERQFVSGGVVNKIINIFKIIEIIKIKNNIAIPFGSSLVCVVK